MRYYKAKVTIIPKSTLDRNCKNVHEEGLLLSNYTRTHWKISLSKHVIDILPQANGDVALVNYNQTYLDMFKDN